MSRPIKIGLDYFPLDVHLDEKIEILEAKHGIIAFAVIIKLYQRIYSNGYFCNWGDTETLLFAKRNNVDVNVAITIVNDAITHKLFDKTLFENYGILTSTGIQKRFFEIKKRSNVEIDSQYLLIKTSEKQCKDTETQVNVTKTQVNVAETLVNTESSTQSKVNKIKANKIPPYISPLDDNSQKNNVEEKPEPPPDTDERLRLERIQNIWNCFAKEHGLPQAIDLTAKRKKAIKARSKEKKFDLQLIFDKIKSSDFLLGKCSGNWRVDFDFVFCSSNKYLKILEGKYKNNSSVGNHSPPTNSLENKIKAKAHLVEKYQEMEVSNES